MGCLEKTPSSPRATASIATVDVDEDEDDLVVLAVMGKTGSGKSSFVSNASGQAVNGPAIGRNLESCTDTPTPYTFEYGGKTIVLIDNPGFGDTYRDEGEILAEIAGFLASTYREGVKLSGIVYLHDITNNRMTNEGRSNLEVFKLLCGEEPLHKIILATTRWTSTNRAEAMWFLEQLKTKPEYWKDMIDGGSRVERLDNTRDSALNIIDIFLEDDDQDKVTLTIQDEMVKYDLRVSETAAGKSLNEAIARAIEELEAKYARQQQQMQEQFDQRFLKIRKEESAKTKKKIYELRMQQERLDEDERIRARKIDMELDQWKKRIEQGSLTGATHGKRKHEYRRRSSCKEGAKIRHSRGSHSGDHHSCRRHSDENKAAECKPDKDDELKKASEAAAEAERILKKQMRREHLTKLGTAFTTTAVAGGLSVINPAAIPVAVLGGVDTIKCIARFFKKEKEAKANGTEMVTDTLAQSMAGGP